MDVVTPDGLRILALDGGEARCISQLVVLEEFMHRLEIDTGRKYLPCEYYHFMIGSGAGGVIAALLVVFRMSTEEAIKAYVRICSVVFAKDYNSTERSKQLEYVLKDLMDECNIAQGTKLRQSKEKTSVECKIALCYVSATNLSQLRLFRNYASRQASYNPTVLQAVRACWATPNLFDSIMIGPEGLEEEIISCANGFNNPALEAIKEIHDTFGPDVAVACFLSLGAGRSLFPRSLHPNSSAIETLKTFEELAMNCESAAKEVERRIGRLGIYFRLSVDRGFDFNVHSITAKRLGEIVSHTTSYLHEDAVNKIINECIYKAEKPSRVTLESLYRSKSAGFGSAHGLPPLSAFFIMRRAVMDKMVNALIENHEDAQHIAVLSGLGGSGKTQIVLKFARDFEDRFEHIFFIDASSSESIKSGLISRVRSLGREYERNSVEEALEVLSEPDSIVTRDWCLIYDNADNVNVQEYLPNCDHGSIIITTRNPLLADLAPDSHIPIDVMFPEEAVDALIGAAFSRDRQPTEDERIEVGRIVEHLGNLPVAIIQAGCFIKQQHCLNRYLELLGSNRVRLLERPTRVHRDKLKYDHSVYAAFDVTLDVLSVRARQLLRILSTVHYTDFPLPLFAISTKSQFRYEPSDLLDRPPEFQDTIEFLTQLLCPSGAWEENDLMNLLEELQRYSLVVLVSSERSIVTLRFHPLVHLWARDRMTEQEFSVHQAAAIRLLVCGTDWEYEYLFKFLSPQVNALSVVWDTLHVNDRAAFTRIIRADGPAETLMRLSQSIYTEVKAVHGERDIRTSRAALDLADAYGQMEDTATMERMEREVMVLRETLLGKDHPETLEAMLNLSATLYDEEKYTEAQVLQEEVLEARKQRLGVSHKDTAEAMISLAETYFDLDRVAESADLQSSAVETLTKVLGRTHYWTLDAMVGLADYYRDLGNNVEADKLQQEVLTAERASLGGRHLDVLGTMEWIGEAYVEQGRYDEAVKLWEEIVSTRREEQGPTNLDTLNAIAWLARVYATPGKGRISDAERLRIEEVHGRRITQGTNRDTADALFWLARLQLDQKKFKESSEAFIEVWEMRTQLLGEDNIATLNAFSWVARLDHELGRHAEAQRKRQYELEKRLLLYGEQKAETMDAMSWLARAHREQGHREESLTLLRRELELRKAAEGAQSVNYLNALSWIVQDLFEKGKYGEGETAAIELVEGRRITGGPQAIDTLNSVGWLARCIQEQGPGRLAEAEALRVEELKIRREVQGEDPATFNTLSWLVKLYLDQGRLKEMEQAAVELLEGRKRILGDHIDILNAMRWLSRAYQEQGRQDEAGILLDDALPLIRKERGDRHADTLNTLERLILIRQAQGRYDEMLALAEEQYRIKREMFGDNNADTVNARAQVAWALMNVKRYEECVEMFQEILAWRSKELGPRHLNVGITKKRLAEAYHVMGDDIKAKRSAEEAIDILRETQKEDNVIVREILELAQRIDGISVSGAALPRNVEVTDRTSGSLDSDLDGPSAPDPDDGPSSPPQGTSLSSGTPAPRMRGAFEPRRGFGRHPTGNPWSMFS